jgi:hypothetical protein
MLKKNQKKGIKIWTITTADKKFSKYIINRDKVCQRCGKSNRRLTCSHFWVRQHYATRFDPENCVALCVWCHTFDKDNWENDRNGEYEAYMMNKLGDRGFEDLKKRHLKQVKRFDSILGLMKFLKNAEVD